MAAKSWSQAAGNEASIPAMNWNAPVASSSKVEDPPLTVSLNDIMSEQLAVELSDVDKLGAEITSTEIVDQEYLKQFMAEAGLETLDDVDFEVTQAPQLTKSETETSDEALARMLQREFDLEHDRRIIAEERNYNQNSKVKLSFQNRRLVKDVDLEDLEDEEPVHEYGEDSQHWDFFEEKERTSVKVGQKGFTINNGQVTTKHDLEANKCRNACKVMEFESDINTGDGGCFPMKISNSVYNTLKLHSVSEGKRMARLHEKKEKSTAEKAMDEKSRIILFKLIDRDILETVNGVVATGKESVVVHGIGSNPEKGITKCEVAIKIFKTTITEFVNRINYIVGDPVLEQAGKLSKQNPKLTIPLWAEKEMHNLHRMKKNGIACPEVLLLKKNILIMRFIGKDGRPAPTLKMLIYDEKLFEKVYEATVNLMIKLYKDCDLIHADLSEYNLMWFENKLWCIDVSQSVRNTHPMAFRFLWRDCINVTKFFSKKSFESPIMTAEELFTLITGRDIDSVDSNPNAIELLDKMENFERNDEKLAWRNYAEGVETEDCFDELFAKSVRERAKQEVPEEDESKRQNQQQSESKKEASST